MPSDTYCIMGNPVEHSRSPWIHARFAALTGQQLNYERRKVPLDGFTQALKDFAAGGGRGCNITVPFKLEAAEAADSRSDRVSLAGAANTLHWQPDGRLHADNTDGLGLVADIRRNAGVTLAGTDILLIGAGGAAAGVLGPLIEQKPARICVCNRTQAKAEELVARHTALAAEHGVTLEVQAQQSITGSFAVVINATATSLQAAGVPVAASVLQPGGLAYDMMYGPAAAQFLAWAAAHGAIGRDGLGMLVEQAAESFALWRGVRPPAQKVLQELRDLLAAKAA